MCPADTAYDMVLLAKGKRAKETSGHKQSEILNKRALLKGWIMAVTCREVMGLDICSRLKLLGGANGLDRVVTWPYIKNMDTISQWIHGGELIFVIGAREDISESGLLRLMNEANRNGISGVVLLIGEEYLKRVPKSVIRYANEHNIPLFKMPFLLKLIDITREISGFIVRNMDNKRENRGFSEKSMLEVMLAGKEKTEQLAYCWGKLQPLLEADKVLKSEYVTTLYQYLRCNNDLLKTSEHMFIHRNTLVNRMKKIAALLNTDLNKASVRNEFYNIYQVLSYYGELQSQEENK